MRKKVTKKLNKKLRNKKTLINKKKKIIKSKNEKNKKNKKNKNVGKRLPIIGTVRKVTAHGDISKEKNHHYINYTKVKTILPIDNTEA